MNKLPNGIGIYHLEVMAKTAQIEIEVLEIKKQNPKLTLKQISDIVGVSTYTVGRLLRRTKLSENIR